MHRVSGEKTSDVVLPSGTTPDLCDHTRRDKGGNLISRHSNDQGNHPTVPAFECDQGTSIENYRHAGTLERSRSPSVSSAQAMSSSLTPPISAAISAAMARAEAQSGSFWASRVKYADTLGASPVSAARCAFAATSSGTEIVIRFIHLSYNVFRASRYKALSDRYFGRVCDVPTEQVTLATSLPPGFRVHECEATNSRKRPRILDRPRTADPEQNHPETDGAALGPLCTCAASRAT